MDRDYEYWQAVIWRTIMESGVRWSEAARLRTSDLVRNVLMVRASTTKSKKSRPIPLSPKLVDELKALPKGEYLFHWPLGGDWADKHGKDALRQFYRTLERTKIPARDEEGRSLNIHALRMTYASRLQRRKVQIGIVQKVLGHADVWLNARCYSDFGVKETRKAVSRAW